MCVWKGSVRWCFYQYDILTQIFAIHFTLSKKMSEKKIHLITLSSSHVYQFTIKLFIEFGSSFVYQLMILTSSC